VDGPEGMNPAALTRRCVVKDCRSVVRGPAWAVCERCFARMANAEPMKPNGRAA
jgi:hypothetical protein